MNCSKTSRVLRFNKKEFIIRSTYNLSFINAVTTPKLWMNRPLSDRARTVQFSGHYILAWRSKVTLRGSWNMPDLAMWPPYFSRFSTLTWLVASARGSKRDVRFSAQRIQWNSLHGAAGACLYRQGTSLSLSTLLSWYSTSAECEQQPHNLTTSNCVWALHSTVISLKSPYKWHGIFRQFITWAIF